MHEDQTSPRIGNPPPGADGRARSQQLTRRQALGRISAVATAGAAVWVVPEILTAKPAAGATLSGVPNIAGSGGSGSTSSGNGGGTGVSTSPSTSTGSAPAQPATPAGSFMPPATGVLANTGDDLTRDAAIAGAMVAGGWVLQRWASRTPTRVPAEAGDVPGPRADQPGRSGRTPDGVM